jgi:hypothetical protein
MAGFLFANQEIHGLFGNVRMSPRVLQSQRTKFFGVHGVSEITGGQAERQIIVQHWLFNEYSTPLLCTNAIEEIDNLVGRNGPLIFNTATAQWSIYDCTYDGHELIQLPMLDVAGTMDGGYWAELMMYFTQLSTAE